MFADQIEKMKREYTDKYVLVDGTRPELARFRDVVGRVKTVNMSGRALVEFDDYHLNIGWYDIDPEFLKVVDKPPPKAPKPEAKKAAPKAAPAAKEKPAAKPAAAPAAAKAGKPSVAEMLAAAGGGAAKTGSRSTGQSESRNTGRGCQARARQSRSLEDERRRHAGRGPGRRSAWCSPRGRRTRKGSAGRRSCRRIGCGTGAGEESSGARGQVDRENRQVENDDRRHARLVPRSTTRSSTFRCELHRVPLAPPVRHPRIDLHWWSVAATFRSGAVWCAATLACELVANRNSTEQPATARADVTSLFLNETPGNYFARR